MNSTQYKHRSLKLALLFTFIAPAIICTSTTNVAAYEQTEGHGLEILKKLATPHYYEEGMSWEQFIDVYVPYLESVHGCQRIAAKLQNLRDADADAIIYTLWNSIVELPREMAGILSQIDKRTFTLRINECRAIQFISDTFMEKSHRRKKVTWTEFVDTVTELLAGNSEYTDICTALKNVRTSRTWQIIGLKLKSCLQKLPDEIKRKGTRIGEKHIIDTLKSMLS